MAVTYLSGQRVQGSSTGAKTPTYEADFSSGWSGHDGSYLAISGSGATSKITFDVKDDYINSGNGYVTLKTLSSAANDSLWTLRFKLTFTTIADLVSTANESQLAVGIWNGTGISGEVPSGLDGLTFSLRNVSNTILTSLSSYETGSWQRTDGTDEDQIGTSTTTAYVELKRTSATEATIKVYSDSNYSTQVGATVTDTGISSNTGLEYLAVRIYTQTVGSSTIFGGTIEDMDFWDNSSATQDDKTTVTDVPVGSEFEQTDNYKTYQNKKEDSYTNDYSTAGDWTERGTAVTVDDGSYPDVCKCNDASLTTNSEVFLELPFTLSDSTWKADFKYYLTADTGSGGFPIVFSDTDVVVRDVDCDAIGYMANGSGAGNIFFRNGSTKTESSQETLSTSTQYWCRLERVSTTEAKFYAWTDSYDGTLVSGFPITQSSLLSGVVDLKYIHHGTCGTVASGNMTWTVDDLTVTSGENTWVERGTAI